jgi:hypothetical protein
MAFVPVSTVVPMNHVRTAAEAHHQVEKGGEH